MKELEQFKQQIAKSDTIPHDLEVLVLTTIEQEESPFDEIELTAIMPDEESGLWDNSYLTTEELADPDIQSNIIAIDYVRQFATFVAQQAGSGYLFGYWHGLNNRDFDNSPIICYDTEGQFSVYYGGSLVETVCAIYAFDDKDLFKELKKDFKKIGINFSIKKWEDVYDNEPKTEDDPAELHLKIYNEERIKRGLKPVE